jgi:hypothetical protein
MTSYMTKIATCVTALAVISAIGATSAMAISPHDPHYGPTGLRYSRGEPVATPVQSTAATSTPMQLNLPPIAGVKIETPVTPLVTPQTASADTGFDWTDAAIGALTTAGVCIVLMGLALGIRRRNEPTTA